jgi:hypothetical protein
MILGRIGGRLVKPKEKSGYFAMAWRHLSITRSSRVRSITQLFASERNF